MICRQTAKDYNKLVLELASRLRESGLDKADAVTAGFLREQNSLFQRMAPATKQWPMPWALHRSTAC